MKKSLRISTSLLAVAATFTLAAGVQAQTNTTRTGPMVAVGASYADFNVGRSDFSVDNGIGFPDRDDGDTAYSAHIGSYFNENFGLELGYTDFGSINRAGGETSARGINLSLVGKYPITPEFNVLGKIGTTYSDTDVSASPTSGVATGSENGFGLSYGLGVEYAFTPQWSALLQYESHKMKFAGDADERIGMASIGVRYRY